MIPNNTNIQSVNFRVRDLKESLNFYVNLLGLKEKKISDSDSELYSDLSKPYLIKLSGDKNAKYPIRNNTGIFHIAVRLPNRKELAKVFLRLFEHKYKFQGFSDHLVSEAIYLTDPEDNGIELYTDKNKDEWNWINGEIEMDTLPLDLSKITKELGKDKEWSGIHPDTDIGHIHLKVSDLAFADMFYGKLLGFNVTSRSYPGALFLAANGYHHHIGANIWQSHRGSSPKDNSTGLISFTINIPDKEYLAKLSQTLGNEGLLLNTLNDNSLLVKDFDNIKILLTLQNESRNSSV